MSINNSIGVYIYVATMFTKGAFYFKFCLKTTGNYAILLDIELADVKLEPGTKFAQLKILLHGSKNLIFPLHPYQGKRSLLSILYPASAHNNKEFYVNSCKVVHV